MTSVPLPTVVPQDAWYTLTTGGINPSQNDSVPNASFLSPDGSADGVIGALDGALIYLQGLVTQLDGGQGWFMWEADSSAAANGTTIFDPHADGVSLGRWIKSDTPEIVATGQAVTVGTSVAILPSATMTVHVDVQKTGSATTLFLPASRQVWQSFIIHANSDASLFPCTVDGNGALIDGSATDILVQDNQERSYMWNGTKWRASA